MSAVADGKAAARADAGIGYAASSRAANDLAGSISPRGFCFCIYSPSCIMPILRPNLKLRSSLLNSSRHIMESVKRAHDETKSDENSKGESDEHKAKTAKIENVVLHGKGRPVPQGVLKKLTPEEISLLENVKSSCTDLEQLKAAVKLRLKYRLSKRLPDDYNDSSYYVEGGLRRVYPYSYLYQSYAKRRWLDRRLKDILKQEFRDISDAQLKWRFQQLKVLVNGETVGFEYIVRDNDFIANLAHRHELPVLAAPIKFISRDKNMIVIDKPPSVPIHPCGRYRYNSVINILKKEHNLDNIKVIHRLDRLVSGVLLLATSSAKAHIMEDQIKNRDVQKVYVCRVAGEFPPDEITVNQPLEIIPGKIGISVTMNGGKDSVTKFKRLNYNGKTSAVLCEPLTGRMHQIRVHLQYLGHPIVNDSLYNCDSFGPERGKGGKYGKSIKQLSDDVVAKHRASSWLISEDNDLVDYVEDEATKKDDDGSEEKSIEEVQQFVSEEEKQETMAALAHYFTNESCTDLEKKWQFKPEKLVKDPTCRDCVNKYYDPPMRQLFLYLHALKYSGADWSYESEMPVWGKDTWQF